MEILSKTPQMQTAFDFQPEILSQPETDVLFPDVIDTDMASASQWLDWMIEQSKDGPFGFAIRITPALAKALLNLNSKNRNLSQYVVKQYADDAKNNRWRLNGQAIVVSVDSVLNDGQHRLTAIVLTGQAMDSFVVFGVSTDSRMTLDQGRVRKVSDHLQLAGYHNTSQGAAAAAMLHKFENERSIDGALNTSKTAIRDYYFDHAEEINEAISVVGTGSGRFQGLLTPAFSAFLFVALRRRSSLGSAAEFFEILSSGIGVTVAKHPIMTLKNRLIKNPPTRDDRQECLEMCVKAWNSWRKGETLAKIQVTGKIPLIRK